MAEPQEGLHTETSRSIKDRALHLVSHLPDDEESALAVLAEAEWLVRNFYGNDRIAESGNWLTATPEQRRL